MTNWKEVALKYENNDWSFSSVLAWKKTIIQHPTNKNLLSYANQLRLTGNYEKAIETVDRVDYHSIPNEYKFTYHIHKGMIYSDACKIHQAIECFQNATQLHPRETYPYVFLGTSLATIGDLNGAKRIFKTALNKKGDIDEVYYNLSLIHARMNKFKKAVNAMKKCIKIDPEYPK